MTTWLLIEVVRFSVVAPVLNEIPVVATLFFCGLQVQTFQDFEVILVDGGSTDGTLEEARRWEALGHFSLKVVVDTTRNIGYIRNVGARHATGEILVETSGDVYFPPDLLERLDAFYRSRPRIVAVGGRTIPYGAGASFLAHAGYACFDLLRFALTTRVMPVKKIRPSGNFLSIYLKVFWELGGYPEVRINEDGLFGYKLDDYQRAHPEHTVRFSLEFYVVHNVKRFEQKGGLQGLLFYIYVFGVIFPMLQPLLAPIERRNAQIFASRSDLR